MLWFFRMAYPLFLKLSALTALILLSAASSQATEWHVERDGSGDFRVIQEAVDAAHSGDTIVLGPGRFSETSDFQYYNGRTIQTCVSLEKSLTFIGSGQGKTFIGPEGSSRARTEYGTAGIASISDNLELVVQDLTFIDCDGISVLFNMETDGDFYLERVGIENSYGGIFLKNSSRSRVFDCYIHDILYDGVHIYEEQFFEMRNCQFQNCNIGFTSHFSGASLLRISDCQIVGGLLGGIFIYNSSNTKIEDCLVQSDGNYGLYIMATTNLQIENVFAGGNVDAGAAFSNNEGMQVEGSVFEGNLAAVGIYIPSSGMQFHNNHILNRDGSWSVWTWFNYNGSITELDFTNNYWGTTDPDEIAASIWDRNDDPAIRMTVDFQPMADGPVSTESKTLDQVKALFR